MNDFGPDAPEFLGYNSQTGEVDGGVVAPPHSRNDFGPDAPEGLSYNSQTGLYDGGPRPSATPPPELWNGQPICSPRPSLGRRAIQSAGDWVVDHLPGTGTTPHQHYCD